MFLSICSSHDHDDHDHGDHDHGDHGHGDHEKESLLHKSGHGHAAHDVNLEAAYLHVLTDLAQSIGVAIAGFIIWWKPHWQIVDPLCTLLFSIFVVWSTVDLIGRVVGILFEGGPAHIDSEKVKLAIEAIPGVTSVRDLHIWSVSSNSVAMTCHMKVIHYCLLSE